MKELVAFLHGAVQITWSYIWLFKEEMIPANITQNLALWCAWNRFLPTNSLLTNNCIHFIKQTSQASSSTAHDRNVKGQFKGQRSRGGKVSGRSGSKRKADDEEMLTLTQMTRKRTGVDDDGDDDEEDGEEKEVGCVMQDFIILGRWSYFISFHLFLQLFIFNQIQMKNSNFKYCKRGNIHGTLIFADFAVFQQARIQKPAKIFAIFCMHILDT